MRKMRLDSLLFKLAYLFLLVSSFENSLAQEVRINLSPKKGPSEETFSLSVQIISQDGFEVEAPRFEESNSFSIFNEGTSQRITIVNGRQSRLLEYILSVSPSAKLTPGKYRLPAGSILINGKRIPLKGPELEITPSTQQHSPGLDFIQLFEREQVYVGEQVIYRTEFASENPVERYELEQLTSAEFLRESLGRPEERRRAVGRGQIRVYSTKEAFFPLKPGKLRLSARDLTAKIYQPRRGDRIDPFFGNSFIRLNSRIARKRLTADPVHLEVLPLPDNPIPTSGFIPVGSLRMKARVDATEIVEGEGVNLTVTLSGDAYLRSYNLPEPSGKDVDKFKQYAEEPKARVDVRQGRAFYKKTFSVAFIPQEPGEFELPQFEIVYFDPKKKQYFSLQSPEKIIRVKADPFKKKTPREKLSPQIPKESPSLNPEPKNNPREQLMPSPKPFSSSLYWSILLFLPFSTFVIWYFRREKRPASSPSKDYLRMVDASSSAEDLAAVTKEFLSERLGVPLGAITSKDPTLIDALPTTACRQAASSLLRELEYVRYSKDGLTSKPSDELRKKTKSMVQQIESEVE